MFNLNEILTFNCESAYDYAYDLSMKKNYSPPKIYTVNGDLSKRWYVYFSYRNSKTGKLKRITPFYGEAHKYKTKEDRLYVLSAYLKNLLELLKKGYNPFEENTELHQKNKELETNKKVTPTPPKEIIKPKKIDTKTIDPILDNQKTLKEAFDFALKLKKNVMSDRTYYAYEGKSNALRLFVAKNYPTITHIHLLSKKIVVQFL